LKAENSRTKILSTYPYAVQSLRYDGAGHVLRPPYLPTTATLFVNPETNLHADLGGIPSASAAAATDWWARLLGFLRTALDAAT
jgi:hypothetical protein